MESNRGEEREVTAGDDSAGYNPVDDLLLLGREALVAKFELLSVNQAATTLAGSIQGEQTQDRVMAYADELAEQCKAVSDANDMRLVEWMLVAQAKTLEAMFHNLAQQSMAQQNPRNLEMLLRLALKAQGQSRATLQTLGELKNPKSVAFVRQANIANGHQQINNGTAVQESGNYPTATRAHVGNADSVKNELLTEGLENDLDTRASQAPSGVTQNLEAMEKIYRTKDD